MEAYHHKFPTASTSFAMDFSDGNGPQFVGTPDPPMSDLEATAELVLIDAAIADKDALDASASTLKTLLSTGKPSAITNYANSISVLTILTLGPDLKARLDEIYKLLALLLRK